MPRARAQIVFRSLAVAAVVSAFFQVTLGGIVRVTGSGLGCPDWPLCHGQIIPPFDTATLIEYSHRLSATVLGLFVVAVAVVAWKSHRGRRDVLYPIGGAIVLVGIAAVLGGVTVLTELEWWVVLFHLGVAEILVGCLIFAAIAGWSDKLYSGDLDTSGTTGALAIGSVAGTFALILSGSYMVGYGAGPACGDWPLCRGEILPEGNIYLIHMLHRFAAAAIGVVVLAAAWRVWRLADDNASRVAALCVAASFLLQVGLGAVLIWTGFTAEFKAIHLSVATLVWVALVAMATLVCLRQPASEPRSGALAYGRS